MDELASTADIEEEPRLREEYGKMYVRCGRELFEAQERLRGGTARVEFLEDHSEDIRKLSELLIW